jgi:tRNA threonylcarbamoyladenosine biosynthesis protein TsaE
MIANQYHLMTHTVEETRNLGKTIGRRINHPLVIGLCGELGSGKTAFVQGLAQGLEVPGDYYITSPTFTLINEYPGRLPLYHVDLYRLAGIHDLEDIGLVEMLDDQAVIAIEWAQKMLDDLPAEHLAINFEITDNDHRRIGLNAFGNKVVSLIKPLEERIEGMK